MSTPFRIIAAISFAIVLTTAWFTPAYARVDVAINAVCTDGNVGDECGPPGTGVNAKCVDENGWLFCRELSCDDPSNPDCVIGAGTLPIPILKKEPTKAPVLSVDIPTVKFSDALKYDTGGGSRIIELPWIADYVNGVIIYAVGAAAVVAATMIMIGGFQYLLAGGNSSAVGAAKKRMLDATAGLLIAVSAPLLLSVINPQLNLLSSVRISTVQSEQSEFAKPAGAPKSTAGTAIELGQQYKTPQDLTVPSAGSCKSKAVTQALRDDAVALQSRTGIPAAIVLAQWSLESGDGTSCIGPPGKRYNCWGVKCTSGGTYAGNEVKVSDVETGAAQIPTCPSGCSLSRSTEVDPNQKALGKQKYYACFQNYDRWEQALEAHAKVLKRRNWQEYAKNPVGFAYFVKAIGYATGERYAEALITRMQIHCLATPSALSVGR